VGFKGVVVGVDSLNIFKFQLPVVGFKAAYVSFGFFEYVGFSFQ